MRIFLMTVVTLSVILPFSNGATIQTQEMTPANKLSLELEFCKPFVEASDGSFEVSAFISRDQRVTIEVVAKGIKTRNHSATALPPEPNRISDWYARFKLIPKLNAQDLRVMTKLVESFEEPNSKLNQSHQQLLELLPDVQNEEYAYSVAVTYLVPVEERDQKRVLEFIDLLSKRVHASDGGDTQKLLRFRLLDKR